MSAWNDIEKRVNDFENTTSNTEHTPITPAENTEPPEPPKKKAKRKYRKYLRLDITGLEDYILDATANRTKEQKKPISMTGYIQDLIKKDKELWERKERNNTDEKQ